MGNEKIAEAAAEWRESVKESHQIMAESALARAKGNPPLEAADKALKSLARQRNKPEVVEARKVALAELVIRHAEDLERTIELMAMAAVSGLMPRVGLDEHGKPKVIVDQIESPIVRLQFIQALQDRLWGKAAQKHEVAKTSAHIHAHLDATSETAKKYMEKINSRAIEIIAQSAAEEEDVEAEFVTDDDVDTEQH